MYIYAMRVPLASSGLRESDIELVNQVLRSGNLTMGSEVKKFEKLMCKLNFSVADFLMVNNLATIFNNLFILNQHYMFI